MNRWSSIKWVILSNQEWEEFAQFFRNLLKVKQLSTRIFVCLGGIFFWWLVSELTSREGTRLCGKGGVGGVCPGPTKTDSHLLGDESPLHLAVVSSSALHAICFMSCLWVFAWLGWSSTFPLSADTPAGLCYLCVLCMHLNHCYI